MPTCNDCVIAKHSKHDVKKLTEIENEQRQEVEKLIDDVNEGVKKWEEAHMNMGLALTDLHSVQETAKSDIEKTFEVRLLLKISTLNKFTFAYDLLGLHIPSGYGCVK